MMTLLRRFDEWLRDRMIDFLLDCLCLVLPRNKRYQVTIEAMDDRRNMAELLEWVPEDEKP